MGRCVAEQIFIYSCNLFIRYKLTTLNLSLKTYSTVTCLVLDAISKDPDDYTDYTPEI